MRGTRVENGRVVYFGNPVGYITGDQAVVGLVFRGRELETYLEQQGGIETVVWKDGIYGRLMNGQAEAQDYKPLKSCQIWQLKPNVNIHMKLTGCDTLVTRFGEPNPQNYHVVHDGETETNELERIYDKFDDGQEVPGYTGHSLSMSDVIELHDEEANEFYYMDYRGFRPVVFEGSEPVQSQVFQLQQWKSGSEWLSFIM